MTAVVLAGGVGFVLAPRVLRFGEINPLSGTAYLVSRFAVLPPWVADVVTDVLGLRPRDWDACVATKRAPVEQDKAFSLVPVLEEALRRKGCPEPGLCVDCWGSGLVGDPKGERTEVAGAVFVCPCLGIRVHIPGVTVIPPEHGPVTVEESASTFARCRMERGWSKAETARRLVAARRARGLCPPSFESVKKMYRWWEEGRHQVVEWRAEFCSVFGKSPGELGFSGADMQRRGFTVPWDQAAFVPVGVAA
jgi:hypothetical protein